MPNFNTKVGTGVVDDPIALDATYKGLDTNDRRKIDDQILGTQTVALAALAGATTTTRVVDSGSATIAAGDVLLAASTAQPPNVTRLTSALLSSGASVEGIALAAPVSGVRVITSGFVPNSITGLGAGTRSKVAVNTSGGSVARLYRVAYPTGAELMIGTCDTAGNVTMQPTAHAATAPVHVINVKAAPYYAAGDGVTDDTAAIQKALDALMAAPTSSGVIFFPSGTYQITYSLQFVGDVGHAFVFRGECGGQSTNTRIRWAGPAGCTMLDCWGLNFTVFENIIFDGGSTNANIGGNGVVPGAGCAVYLHTNQYNNGPVKTGILAGSPCNFVWFDTVTFGGITNGLYSALSIGDGSKAPQSMTVSAAGTYTLYRYNGAAAPTVGDNAVDTYASSTVSVLGNVADHSVSVADTTPFIPGRAIIFSPIAPMSAVVSAGTAPPAVTLTGTPTGAPQIAIAITTGGARGTAVFKWSSNGGATYTTGVLTAATVALGATGITANFPVGTYATDNVYTSYPGQSSFPYQAMVTSRSVASGAGVVTFADAPARGNGLPFSCPVGTRVSNVYPNATWDSARHAPDTIVDLPAIINNSQLSAIGLRRCTWYGGGRNCFNAGEYAYACVGIYSGFNTEQFWFRDCQFGTQSMVYGIYSPYAANNEFFVQNAQIGSFVGAGMRFGSNSARIDIDQCGTESAAGCGYFVWNDAGQQGGFMTIRNCELVYDNVANPYYGAIRGSGYWRVDACSLQAFFYNTPSMPPVVSAGTAPPTVTLTGTPAAANTNIIISITTGGTLGTAIFKWSSNGGSSYTSGVTAAASVVLGATGLTANFAAGTYATDNVYTSYSYNLRPSSIDWSSGNGQGPGCLRVTRCQVAGETYQLAVFNAGVDMFAGSAAEGQTNGTHAFNTGANTGQVLYSDWGTRLQVELQDNSGTDAGGTVFNLRNTSLNPESVHALGMASNGVATSGGNRAASPATYRNQQRTVTTCLEVDYTDDPTTLWSIFLATLQDRTIIDSVIVEVTQSFSSARTLQLGTQQGGYKDIFTSVPLPAAGNFLCAHAQLTPTTAVGTTPPAVTITGAPTATGQVIVAITTPGTLGVAVFKWSIDGGITYETGVATAASVVLGAASAPGRTTGITVNFPAGTYATDNVYTSTAISTMPIFVGIQSGSNALRLQWGAGATLTTGHIKIYVTTTVLGSV